MITSAAIKFNGTLHIGNEEQSHAGIMVDIAIANDLGFSDVNDHCEKGFVDDKGQFYRRAPAAAHALRCGQITKLRHDHELYTTDLWGGND